MTSLINNFVMTVKHSWPVIVYFFLTLAITIIFLLIFDLLNPEKEDSSEEAPEINDHLLIIGGEDVRQESVYLALLHGWYHHFTLVTGIIVTCARNLGKLIIRIWMSLKRTLRWIIREGDRMPYGEKLMAHHIIQTWIIIKLVINT